MEKIQGSNLLYDPNQSAQALISWLSREQWNDIATWDIPSLDKVMSPLQPGEIMGLIARPGHGKTAMAIAFSKNFARKLAEAETNQVVVYATYDETVEDIEALFQSDESTFSVTDLMRGDVPIQRVIENSLKRYKLPVWIMGESVTDFRGTIRMTVQNVYMALKSMVKEYKVKPALVVIDYIQIVPIEYGTERPRQVAEAMIQAKELARSIQAPIIICVQASRRVDTTDFRLPEARDCQWASDIEQISSKLISLWRPYLSHRDVKNFKVEGETFENRYDLLIAQLVKQKKGTAGHKFALRLQPQYCKLEDQHVQKFEEPPEEEIEKELE